MIPDNAPQWLKDADTRDAIVDVLPDGRVVWHGGEWHGGLWHGGVWHGGEWRGGVWYDGVWRGGVWYDGVWRGGVWYDGVWRGGEWQGGEWCGGVWGDSLTDGLRLRLALLGMVPGVDGLLTGYRSVSKSLRGRFIKVFRQKMGRVDVDHAPAGAGTCHAGLHVTTAARAWTYFGVDPTARLIEARFSMDDVLDCDGEKVRLKGAMCREIPWPFLKEKKP